MEAGTWLRGRSKFSKQRYSVKYEYVSTSLLSSFREPLYISSCRLENEYKRFFPNHYERYTVCTVGDSSRNTSRVSVAPMSDRRYLFFLLVLRCVAIEYHFLRRFYRWLSILERRERDRNRGIELVRPEPMKNFDRERPRGNRSARITANEFVLCRLGARPFSSPSPETLLLLPSSVSLSLFLFLSLPSLTVLFLPLSLSPCFRRRLLLLLRLLLFFFLLLFLSLSCSFLVTPLSCLRRVPGLGESFTKPKLPEHE